LKSVKALLRVCAIFLLAIISSSVVLVGPVWATPIDVTVNSDKTIGTNRFSLGTMPGDEWRTWRDRPVLQQLTKDANFGLIRMFSNRFQPATSWNEATKTGTFDWTKVDSMVQTIFAVDAQPEITMMYCYKDDRILGVPSGMAINPTTKLPYPDSYAAYARAWVKHFKDKGWDVRYYDLFNEAYFYYWKKSNVVDYTRLGYYLNVFNRAYDAMHAENPKVIVGSDSSLIKPFMDYWIDHGGKLDMLAFHKYDANSLSESDSTVLQRAERRYFDSTWESGSFYSVQSARQKWSTARGVELQAINTESNWGASASSGTDPRIQKVVGAVWTALMVRGSMLSDVDYSTYFSFGSSKSWELSHKSTGGYGFGMINLDDNKPWYPYYVQKLIGNNLAIGDQIVETTSSSSTIRPLAWIHGGMLNLLIICKVDYLSYVQLHGLEGTLSYFKIDKAVSYVDPRLQTGSVAATTTLSLNGYTIMLLQTAISPPPPPPPSPPSTSTIFEDDFESGGFSNWGGTRLTSSETSTVVNTLYHHGAYSAKFTSNGGGGVEQAYSYKTIISSSELYARGYVKVMSSGIADDGDRFHFIAFRANGEGVAYAGWWKTGGVVKWSLLIRHGTGWTTAYSSSSPSLNQWYDVELHWVEESVNGRGELYVNGVLVSSIQGKNTATYDGVDEVRFGLASLQNCSPSTVFGDCFEASSTAIGSESSSDGDLALDGRLTAHGPLARL